MARRKPMHPKGPCPWCGAIIVIGSEDSAILDRICGDCGEKTMAELKAMNPDAAAKFEDALKVRALQDEVEDAERKAGWDPNP